MGAQAVRALAAQLRNLVRGSAANRVPGYTSKLFRLFEAKQFPGYFKRRRRRATSARFTS